VLAPSGSVQSTEAEAVVRGTFQNGSPARSTPNWMNSSNSVSVGP
jgi:hypothetical protein